MPGKVIRYKSCSSQSDLKCKYATSQEKSDPVLLRRFLGFHTARDACLRLESGFSARAPSTALNSAHCNQNTSRAEKTCKESLHNFPLSKVFFCLLMTRKNSNTTQGSQAGSGCLDIFKDKDVRIPPLTVESGLVVSHLFSECLCHF